ncbi:multidrug efflux SMR transporter [Asticcacaulis sp. 201]|nr:multidrug efflux SMR transporter [Asticcacaulis sp. 201]MDV6329544.1 multidrug efflux SMR transporter [Asticcacaulis sp. 201]
MSSFLPLPWVCLITAGLFEVCWAIGLKYSQGFTKPAASIFTVVTLALSMFLLAKAVETLPIGTAYAIWVGIGALGAAILGIFVFHEAVTPLRVVFLAMLLCAIVGLKATSGGSA